jgi:hypothetical protein
LPPLRPGKALRRAAEGSAGLRQLRARLWFRGFRRWSVVFVILIVGFVVVGAALWMEINVNPPLWLHFLLWIPLATVLSLALTRMLKGVLINLQYRNNARPGEIDRG